MGELRKKYPSLELLAGPPLSSAEKKRTKKNVASSQLIRLRRRNLKERERRDREDRKRKSMELIETDDSVKRV